MIDATRMSASYPFLFRPVYHEGSSIVDGGISSNLPAFLFAEEHLLEQFPTLAFDLAVEMASIPNGETPARFVSSLIDTALEASDNLLSDLVPGINRVAVPIPRSISTLKFDLTDAEITALYQAGYVATTEFLNQWEELKNSSHAGPYIQKQLQVRYGNPTIFEFNLEAVAVLIEQRMRQLDKELGLLRTNIMLPTGRPDNSRIVVYHYGFRKFSDSDQTLELDEFGGCTGEVLRRKGPFFADLEKAGQSPEKWGMRPEQQANVASDRKAAAKFSHLSRPLKPQESPSQVPIRGVLSIDSATPLANTGWVELKNAKSAEIDARVREIMITAADVFTKLLR